MRTRIEMTWRFESKGSLMSMLRWSVATATNEINAGGATHALAQHTNPTGTDGRAGTLSVRACACGASTRATERRAGSRQSPVARLLFAPFFLPWVPPGRAVRQDATQALCECDHLAKGLDLRMTWGCAQASRARRSRHWPVRVGLHVIHDSTEAFAGSP